MDRPPGPEDILQAAGLPEDAPCAGLPDVASLHGPERLMKARLVVDGVRGSDLLAGLVELAGRCAGAASAQLSLLADQQIAAAVGGDDPSRLERRSALEDALCTVTVLSGDVLVSADTRTHPWLRDLPPVTSGQVGAYLGVPLDLGDGTLVGALCVYDGRPRDWSDRDVGVTCDIADVIVLELQRAVRTLSG